MLHCYSLMLADQGRFDEALALADRALALDPASVLDNRGKAIILYLTSRYEVALDQSQRASSIRTVARHDPGRACEALEPSDPRLETDRRLGAAPPRTPVRAVPKAQPYFFLNTRPAPSESTPSSYTRSIGAPIGSSVVK